MKYLLFILLLLTTFLNSSEEFPTQEEVAKLYVATFNRAPDAGGLAYWTNDSFDGSPTLSEIAQSFFDQAETKTLYPDGTVNRDFIQSVYANLFNRKADTGGWNYWENELDRGAFSKNSFIQAVINGALDNDDGLDATILANKAEVGLYFSQAGLENVTDAKTIMAEVTADNATVITAKAEIDRLAALLENTALVLSIKTNKENPLKHETIMFTSFITDADGNTLNDSDTLTYTWNFGDATSSNLSSSAHKYETAGSYTVTLSVNNASKTMTVNIPNESIQPTLYSNVFPINPPSQDGGATFYTLSFVNPSTINTKVQRYFDMYYFQQAGIAIDNFFADIVDTDYIWNKNSYDSQYSVNDLSILDNTQVVNGSTIRVLISLDKLKSSDALMYYEKKFMNKYLFFISVKVYTDGSITEQTYTKSSSDDITAIEMTKDEYEYELLDFDTTYNNLEVNDYGEFFDENTWGLLVDGI